MALNCLSLCVSLSFSSENIPPMSICCVCLTIPVIRLSLNNPPPRYSPISLLRKYTGYNPPFLTEAAPAAAVKTALSYRVTILYTMFGLFWPLNTILWRMAQLLSYLRASCRIQETQFLFFICNNLLWFYGILNPSSWIFNVVSSEKPGPS